LDTTTVSTQPGIIKPVKGKWEPTVDADALMVMIPSELDYLVRLVHAHQIRFAHSSLYRLYQSEGENGEPISISGPFIGAPHAAIGMEKLIALGAKRIWVLGWCGSLQSSLPVGTVVLPTAAVSEEGTSAHYRLDDSPLASDETLNRGLEEALSARSLPYRKGPVWTTDALYRETPRKVKMHQENGCLAVDMEMSALMALAAYRSVAVAGLLVVSDELFELRWRPGFSNPLLKRNSRAAGRLLLDFAGTGPSGIADPP